MSDARLITLTADESALWFAERAQTGFLVALWLKPDVAQQLAVAGGQSADSLHLTLCMAGDAAEMGELATYRAIAAIERAVQWWGSVEGKVSGYGRFKPTDSSDDQSVFYASVDILGLTELRQRVIDALYEAGVPPKISHGYTPHITLSYLAKDAPNPVEDVPSVALMFDGVTVMVGSKRIDIPFAPAPVAMFAVRDEGERPALHVSQPVVFAEPPEWAPFLPVPGTYQHPLYGTLDFSPKNYSRTIENFKAGVYQERIPVNVEHERYSSAVGWITDMRLASDGSIEAKVDWNQRGKTLVEDDRYRYVSAEWFDYWSPPDDPSIVHDNIAVGLTLCTRPYFKESVLRPLAASEAVLTRVAASEVAAGAKAPKETGMTEEDKAAQAAAAAAATSGVSDDQVKQLSERILAEMGEGTKVSDPLVRQVVERAAIALAEADSKVKLADDRARTLTEQNAVLMAENRVKVFTDEVMGRGPNSGIAYVGHIPDHVRMLCSLANTYGDKSWEVEHYKTSNRAAAEQIKAGSLFKEIGTARGNDATLTAHDQIDALARELTAKNPNLTHAQAFTQVIDNNAELRAAHARERRG